VAGSRRPSTSSRARARAATDAPLITEPSPPKSSAERDQLRGVLVEAARTELAAVSAAIKFWAAWAESADTFARALDDELAKVEQSGDSSDVVGRVSDLTREYLRSITQLPSTAVKEFNARLETIGPAKPKRTRAARVKD
jgi:hypothetical protein